MRWQFDATESHPPAPGTLPLTPWGTPHEIRGIFVVEVTTSSTPQQIKNEIAPAVKYIVKCICPDCTFETNNLSERCHRQSFCCIVLWYFDSNDSKKVCSNFHFTYTVNKSSLVCVLKPIDNNVSCRSIKLEHLTLTDPKQKFSDCSQNSARS